MTPIATVRARRPGAAVLGASGSVGGVFDGGLLDGGLGSRTGSA